MNAEFFSNDVFNSTYTTVVNWLGAMPNGKMSAVVRLALMFAVPAAIYYVTFINGNRGGRGRFAAACLADGVIVAMPILLPNDITIRAWIITGCVLLLAYLPQKHPEHVYREYGKQRRLRKCLYLLVTILLLVGFVWS